MVLTISSISGPFSSTYFLAKAVALLTDRASIPSTHTPATTGGAEQSGCVHSEGRLRRYRLTGLSHISAEKLELRYT